MATIIKVTTSDEALSLVEAPKITSGDVKVVTLEAELDEHWTGLTISASFHTDKNPQAYEAVMGNDHTCTVPFEVLVRPCYLYIGLRGVGENDEVKTSALVKYKIHPGAPEGDVPSEPTPDVYQQILALIQAGALVGPTGKSAYEYAVEAGYEGSEADFAADLAKYSLLMAVVPSQASTTNKLADKAFVNSSISTETAHYISNEGQPFTSLAQLEAYTGTVTNNDYAFVTGTDTQGNSYFDRYKATVEDETVTWAKEYRLNNSSFTAEQWAAITSGITSGLVALIETALQADDVAAVALSGDYDDLENRPSVYTKTEVDAKLALKADKANTYTKTEVDAKFDVYGERYGARRLLASSEPTLERLWGARGKVANVATGTGKVTNDFDNIYPWSDMHVCNISIVSGEIVVNAYKEDASFKADGSNGQVVVEIPAFYYPPTDIEEGYETYGVSRVYHEGWKLSPKKYIGAYNATNTGSNSGVAPIISTSLTGFRERAQTIDSVCQVMDIDDWNTLCMLFVTEFATLNTQAIMYGAAGMRYNQEDTIASVVSGTEFTCANASQYVSGQAISIGSTKSGTDRTTWVEIDDVSGNTIKLKSSVANLAVGDYISTRVWKTGNTDGVQVSGQMVADNKHPMTYRGIENLWGNIYQWIDGLLIQDNQPYICLDKSKFSSTLTADYEALSYACANANGYAKEMGNDSNYPQARLTKQIGAGAATYYCDYYYQNTGLRGCFFGGDWSLTTSDGLFYFHLNSAPTSTNINIGARFSWKTI